MHSPIQNVPDKFHVNALRRTFSPPIVVRSLLVAVVVGTILNAINQGAEFLVGVPINLMKIALTYTVPFFVASYGAYTAFVQQVADDA